ncbi:helix-turn-helix domain-containing protein [Anaerosacchariphilus polymeriproducens]|uniref:XRE family transcriptional regulator n=1 Tax=Anaerosacchariphilus polymeriproducens TaxID=1812858 RepID=A0A371AV49_9FIRM|nr:helix-turn-helix transcriptional regulator [Anaerosacchariphilus polymeriproducens]RDU23419.1 XRE family transcriptional regulator [Anaerosacchariphilus polymeriproducens]
MNLGKNLQKLRKDLKMSQKEFAEFLDIPQPTMSAYENERISPAIDVLIHIAKKCNTSLDWICGLNNYNKSLSSMSDYAIFLYDICEANEIGCEFEIHDRLENGTDEEKPNETDDRYRWYIKLTFYGNDKSYPNNVEVCQITKRIFEDFIDLESYSISKEKYDMSKKQLIERYTSPITKKDYPELSLEERRKKQLEYLISLENDKN